MEKNHACAKNSATVSNSLTTIARKQPDTRQAVTGSIKQTSNWTANISKHVTHIKIHIRDLLLLITCWQFFHVWYVNTDQMPVL